MCFVRKQTNSFVNKQIKIQRLQVEFIIRTFVECTVAMISARQIEFAGLFCRSEFDKKSLYAVYAVGVLIVCKGMAQPARNRTTSEESSSNGT